MIQEKAKSILEEALANRAQDLYLQATQEHYLLYFRTAQGRKLVETFEEGLGQALIAHFKFCAGMNVGERRRTQLGACWYQLKECSLRLRLSSVGDFEAHESLVIRILHDGQSPLNFWFNNWNCLRDLVTTRGLYLFAGPVGSGKTSLMMCLAQHCFYQKQVMTIEDPVEMVMPDFVQLQVNEMIDNDYDALIKLSLRHRPDLLIVGEIRDAKTARAVIRASLTGYTVFSTVHARSIAGVWTRLLELGLSEWELHNSLQAVVYQRLITGKGMVDIAKGDWENWSEEAWNKKIEKLVANGHLTVMEAAAEKIEPQRTNKNDSAHGKFTC